MIEITQTYRCRDCQSANIIKNGHNVCGNQQYRCKDCGASKVLVPTETYTEARKEEVLHLINLRTLYFTQAD